MFSVSRFLRGTPVYEGPVLALRDDRLNLIGVRWRHPLGLDRENVVLNGEVNQFGRHTRQIKPNKKESPFRKASIGMVIWREPPGPAPANCWKSRSTSRNGSERTRAIFVSSFTSYSPLLFTGTRCGAEEIISTLDSRVLAPWARFSAHPTDEMPWCLSVQLGLHLSAIFSLSALALIPGQGSPRTPASLHGSLLRRRASHFRSAP